MRLNLKKTIEQRNIIKMPKKYPKSNGKELYTYNKQQIIEAMSQNIVIIEDI